MQVSLAFDFNNSDSNPSPPKCDIAVSLFFFFISASLDTLDTPYFLIHVFLYLDTRDSAFAVHSLEQYVRYPFCGFMKSTSFPHCLHIGCSVILCSYQYILSDHVNPSGYSLIRISCSSG